MVAGGMVKCGCSIGENHGSFRSYKRGYRCGECRAANTLWSKVKKEKGESLPTTEKIV